MMTTRLFEQQGAAELLAARSDWPALYDVEALRCAEIKIK